MRSALTCLPLALLFIAIVPSNAQTNAPTTAEPVTTPVPEITTNISPVTTSGPEIIPVVSPVEGSASEPGAVQYYDIPRNMSFYCNIAKTDGEIYDWNKNNISISQVTELKDRYKLEDSNAILVIQHTSEDDAGNYTCKLANLSQHCVSEDDAGNHTCKLANVPRHCVSEDGAGNHTCKLANVSRHCVSEGDAGNHTCKLANVSRHWALKARPYTMLPSTELRAIEGQELKLVCKVFGKPVVPVDWFFNKDAASYNETTNRGVQLKNSTHIKLETNQAGVPNGQLVIEAPVLEDAGAYACLPVVEENLQRSPHANAVIVVHVKLVIESDVREDAGAYACLPVVEEKLQRTPHANAVIVLRFKEMYAAMWPFLGICAEVLVLCAIILVYEKRRTKPELDDSDTDNHDEKKL